MSVISYVCSYIVFYIVAKCVLVFVDIVIHPIIDARFGYFIVVDKNRLIFITDINRIECVLLLTLLLTVLLRLVLTVLQVSSMLVLAILFSLKSNFDVNISLRTSFSFFRSSVWFCNDLIFLLCSVMLSDVLLKFSLVGVLIECLGG